MNRQIKRLDDAMSKREENEILIKNLFSGERRVAGKFATHS